MASIPSSTDEVLSRLLLDIKGLMLLSGSEISLQTLVKEKIVSSHDEEVVKFVSMMNTRKPESRWASLLIAISEMLLASILAVGGLALLAPSVLGFSSPDQLSSYLSQIVSTISPKSLSNPIIPAGEFIISALLLVGAFYNLRIAAANLRAIEQEPLDVRD
jgi:hypothetical protein